MEGQQDEAHAERVHLMLCQHDSHHTHVDIRRHTTHTSLATLHITHTSLPHFTSHTPHPPRGTKARGRGGTGRVEGTRARAEGAEGGLKVLRLLPVCLQRGLQLHTIPLRMPQAALQAHVEEVVPREFSYSLFQSCLGPHQMHMHKPSQLRHTDARVEGETEALALTDRGTCRVAHA